MSYPPPPGINNLPARPPQSAAAPRPGGFKPAFSAPTTSSYTPPTSYGPSAPPSQYGAAPSYSARPSPVGGMSSSSSYQYSQQAQPQSYGPSAPPPSYQGQATSYGAAPQIRNPFPLPGQAASAAAPGGDFDPEMAAQIAQWQSAYVTKDEASGEQQPSRGADASAAVAAAAANVHTPAPGDKKKTVVREGGGKKWTDDTLVEWDPSHLRLFVGNLAGETTDDSLLKAFSRWKSVQKAKVVRDKRTTKSKGFGFVSFSDADDFFQAAKEMNGKYIQSHPVVVRKANTEIKVTNAKEKGRGNKNRKNNHNNNNNNQGGSGAGRGGAAGGYDPQLGPVHGAGITKPGQKTKNGLRLLG